MGFTSSQCVWVPLSSFCPRAIPKGSKTPNAHIIYISSRPLNHLVCGSKGFFKAFFIKPRASTICQRPYKVINDHIIFIKSTRIIKPSNVGQTTSSDFFKSFFIKQGSSWVSSTTLTTPGDPQDSRSIMTLPVGLPNLLLGYHDTVRA